MATDSRGLGEVFSQYVGEQIRGEAAMRSMTTTALAAAMHMDRVTLHRYLTGKRALPLATLYAASIALGVPVRDIVDRAEDRMTREEQEPARGGEVVEGRFRSLGSDREFPDTAVAHVTKRSIFEEQEQRGE